MENSRKILWLHTANFVILAVAILLLALQQRQLNRDLKNFAEGQVQFNAGTIQMFEKMSGTLPENP